MNIVLSLESLCNSIEYRYYLVVLLSSKDILKAVNSSFYLPLNKNNAHFLMSHRIVVTKSFNLCERQKF